MAPVPAVTTAPVVVPQRDTKLRLIYEFFLKQRHLFANLLSFGRCLSVVLYTPHRSGYVALVGDIGVACVAGTQARPVAQAP